MSLNLLTASSEFERSPERGTWETEKKLVPLEPHYFEYLKQWHPPVMIEQIYLSDPSEMVSLRVRKMTGPEGDPLYMATLKSDARLVPNGMLRRETETVISQAAFEAYQATDAPRIFKTRIEPHPGVTIDWIDGLDEPIIEIEDIGINEQAQLFYQEHRGVLKDMTGEKEVDNEWLAHQISPRERRERPVPTIDDMMNIVEGYRHYGVSPVVVTIDGRSGSGKTTRARELQSRVGHSLLISTDDYHRGKKWLEAYNGGKPWTDWDAPIVYDTEALAADVAKLRQGEPIPRRYFDFADQETHIAGEIAHVPPTLIIEGIHAGTTALEGIRHAHFTISTPLATSIGHDLERFRRSERANGSIRSPEERLRYQLESAEPAFQAIERVGTPQDRMSRLGRRVLSELSTQKKLGPAQEAQD